MSSSSRWLLSLGPPCQRESAWSAGTLYHLRGDLTITGGVSAHVSWEYFADIISTHETHFLLLNSERV